MHVKLNAWKSVSGWQSIWQVHCRCIWKYKCDDSSGNGVHSETKQCHRGYTEALVLPIILCPAVALHYSSTQVFVFGCWAGELMLSYCNSVPIHINHS